MLSLNRLFKTWSFELKPEYKDISLLWVQKEHNSIICWAQLIEIFNNKNNEKALEKTWCSLNYGSEFFSLKAKENYVPILSRLGYKKELIVSLQYRDFNIRRRTLFEVKNLDRFIYDFENNNFIFNHCFLQISALYSLIKGFRNKEMSFVFDFFNMNSNKKLFEIGFYGEDNNEDGLELKILMTCEDQQLFMFLKENYEV